MLYIIGIDPGSREGSGGIALFDHTTGAPVDVQDLPTLRISPKSTKSRLDPWTLVEIFGHYKAVWQDTYGALGRDWNPYDFAVAVESQNPMPKQGVSSVCSLCRAYGTIEGVVAALGYPIFQVTPRIWKKVYGLPGKEKEVARTKAIQLFPTMSKRLSLKKNHNRAEALLIADYMSKYYHKK